MEGSNNESECASIPEQSQGIVHNFAGESCMYQLMYVCVFNPFTRITSFLALHFYAPKTHKPKNWLYDWLYIYIYIYIYM